ncbi:RNA-binding S4 domain-containing protein [Enterovirga rhinocerotis]|uniref:Heat shock protein Hsp15 n=1 Tax=Enterovirga rhinocerotis TaxID=1339210 RepID=A0A4R7C5M6_9HYPH|nr:RNA-binding S4 domain-containing protein [Enterovirga rhinocerotis]TDR93860.1 heat shock protein Hsp15 [Enterovirga rhinocerotis]
MSEGRQRLDKWLWFARFAKTRTLAAKLVEAGHVRVNGVRSQVPAKAVGPGDVLTIAVAHRTAVVRILDPGLRRGPFEEARRLYETLDGGDNAALVTAAPDD